MKKFLITILALVPLTLWAQDNTWEHPEEEEEGTKEETVNPDQKYLRGAVPLVDGKVVFSKTIEAPGKSAAQIYDILLKYMQKMTKEKNQINSLVALTDSDKHMIAGRYEEWLVFKSVALWTDKTRLYYVLEVECQDGKADINFCRVHYLYDEYRKPQRMTAEELIVDKEAVNKKNTRLLPISGKFRRKTIDRKDFLFNKFETLLK